MKFSQPNASVYLPNEGSAENALARTTHMAIGAHHDDLEIMAIEGVLACYQHPENHFTGVVVTNGAGSPRTGVYARTSDFEMQAIRVQEQKRAAFIGDYSAQVFLNFPSSAVKDPADSDVMADIRQLVEAARPRVLYTHNLADKHATHVGVAIKVIKALRELDPAEQPQKVYGCEVWRDLGWMLDEDKVLFDCSTQQNLQMALLGVFDSQISGGKRYDLAAMGRRVANATFFDSHKTDQSEGLVFGMDLTPLVLDPDLDIQAYIRGFIDRFANDVSYLIGEML
jgi:LmbE family N-acetylglucosaminyl deacetylase